MGGAKPRLAEIFEYDRGQWIAVYDYVQKMAKRAFPRDPDAAEDIASQCFDIYVRNHAGGKMLDFEAWVGRSINGLKKNHIRNRYQFANIDDEETGGELDRLARSTPPMQIIMAEARFWAAQVEKLPEPERTAYRQLVDGGDLRDIMWELGMGPQEALDCLKRGRDYLWRIAEW